jgi:hypothetical protein
MTFAPELGPTNWLGKQLDAGEGLHCLTEPELDEIAAALNGVRELDFPQITAARFPLPTLGSRLVALGETLRHGRGFVLLRRLTRDRFGLDGMGRALFGLGAHIGVPLPQSWHGELLGNVIDVSDREATARGYQTGGGQRMHTDSCDIIALMCVRPAKSGGASRISSAVAVHNAILAQRPDLAEHLYRGFVYRRMERDAELGSGILVTPPVPTFSTDSGVLSCHTSGSYPRRAFAAGDAVPDALAIEALDTLARLAASPDFHLDMEIGEGDIQFLNNRRMLHGRLDYEDHPELDRRRHMLRLWLHVPTWPPLPAAQVVHGPADHVGWLRQRRPFMEVPSIYLAEMAASRLEAA